MSPLTYHFEHEAAVEIFVQNNADNDALFDALAQRVGTVLAVDRTLGGLCDWIEGSAPAVETLPVGGANVLKAATITVVLYYATPDPLN